ncbi:U-box domain-containing protein 33-like [Fagus crenata]
MAVVGTPEPCSPRIVEEPMAPHMTEDTICVAVGDIVMKSRSTLAWALQKSREKRICILHVHQPAKTIPLMGTRFPASSLTELEVRAYRKIERKKMLKILDEYLRICRQMGVQAVQLHIELDCIEKGIVELISQHGIKKLVMGAAADKNYSRPVDVEVESSLLQASDHCNTHDANDYIKGSGMDITISQGNEEISIALINRLDEEGYADECKGSLRNPQGSSYTIPRCSSVGSLQPRPNMSTCDSTITTSSCSGATVDESTHYTLYNQLQQVTEEAESANREALQETLRRRKGEKCATEAICRAKASESLYAEELKRRKEIEEVLAEEREELEKVKKERDEMQMERDSALREAKELRRKQEVASCMCMPLSFNEFSFSEIVEATRNFDPSLEIGEGGYGNIYKGFLCCTQVAIKKLRSGASQGPSEFQQEVHVLSRLKHPNLVKLIGSCPQVYALIYEFLPNGSLEDRLSCKDNTPPLSWQTRVRIATELCSVLVFLHSHNIVHGDLKPANVLLDATFISKLSDFGISRTLHKISSDTTLCHKTDPKGTLAYMDPEFFHTEVLTFKSDVYSFGIILLQLLTGRPAFGIKKEVEYAINAGNLKALLDPSAGYWPFVQAEQFGRLALKCCDMYRKCRPDLGSEVWQVLEPMRATYYGGSSLISLDS